MPAAGVAFRGLAARGFDRARPWTVITSSIRIAMSTCVAWGWLRSLRPDAVIGFGGYVSIPVGFAAVLRGVPLVLHEQNSVPGLANRVLSRWAKATAVTYEESIGLLKHSERAVLTGNPVRQSVLDARRDRGREALGLGAGSLVLLVFGGSRGARHLNAAVVAMRDRLEKVPHLQVVQIAGRAEAAQVREALKAGGDLSGRWRVVDYIDSMGDALAACDLVVARAGATSIAEVTALGLPAVLVPYPYATDDHQTGNASSMVAHGAAVLVTDAELDGSRLGDVVVSLLGDEGTRATMAAASRQLGRRDAAARVADVVRRAVQSNAPAKRTPPAERH